MTLSELFYRFLLLFVSILILYFFSNRKQPNSINPLIVVVGLCTFSLCYLFTKIEVGVGIGFGLFAIFSVLRFRTQSFSSVEIVFLFATITLSILDILYPIDKLEILFFFQFLVVSAYIGATVVASLKLSKFKNIVFIKIAIENELMNDKNEIQNRLKDSTGIREFDFKIVKINTLLNQADIEIYY